jgi:hypothetical protein
MKDLYKLNHRKTSLSNFLKRADFEHKHANGKFLDQEQKRMQPHQNDEAASPEPKISQINAEAL